MKRFVLAVLALASFSSAHATELIDCPERYANGERLIDGDVLRYPNGNRLKDGAVWRYADGSRIVDGEAWRYSNGNRLIDGRDVWRYPNGNRLKDGKVIRYEDGNRLREADGTFRDTAGNRTNETSRSFVVRLDGTAHYFIEIKQTREFLSAAIQYDADHKFVLRYDSLSADFQPISIRCEVPSSGPAPSTRFTLTESAATIDVQVNSGYDPIKVREALLRALKSME